MEVYDIKLNKKKFEQNQPGVQFFPSYDFIGIISIRYNEKISAQLSLLRTIYVSVILTFGAIVYSKDANDIVLYPIERLIDKVNQIINNPLSAKNQELEEVNKDSDQQEAVLIENTIIKIGTLLALGYGDAGSEIICKNMVKSGDIDPMIPGQKKCLIFGFCDIRQFTDTTEYLQEDVMPFVNNIGDIVHTIVNRFQGSANKNIGDAFLLVWKIDQSYYKINEKNNQIFFIDQNNVSILCDLALLSFVKIHVKLHREPFILNYRNDHRLKQFNPNYQVKMGFGLNIGWGIEGAIGSEYKIDASYLSPNVNLASRLEAATKQYGVPFLFSSDIFDLMTEDLQGLCRQIDYVTVKGSIKPIGLYTVDVDVENIPQSKIPIYQNQEDREQLEQIKNECIATYLLNSKERQPYNALDFININKDLKLAFRNHKSQFLNQFNEAFQLYQEGCWEFAKQKLKVLIKSNDKPSIALYNYIKDQQFRCPENWNGIRQLIEK